MEVGVKNRALNKNNFTAILKKNENIQQIETVELKTIVDNFPYFQSARALYLKGLKNQDSFKYNNELKTTAAYTTDRTVLFDFITSKEFIDEKKEIHQQITTKIIEDHQLDVADEKSATTNDKIKTIEYKPLEIGKPIPFIKSENYSFNQWLQLSAQKPIKREEKSTKLASTKEKIIEKFIKTNPKIEPLSKDKSVAIAIAKNKQDTSLMTETLAKVYVEQKKYENAIQAYRILSLKYPEKSGFFADQIKRVQILQKNKS